MLRTAPPPKSPTTLTNEQVEAWMRANPDRVQRLDSADYDRNVSHKIQVKDEERKQVKRLDSRAIKEALTKEQRKARRVPITYGKTKKPAEPVKPKKAERKVPKRPNRLSVLAKRRRDWLYCLQLTGCSMTSKEVKEMFGISNPRFTAERINQDGEHIAISKELHNNRKTLLFTAIKKDKQ